MPTITQITAQKKNPDRANLYLDGEFFGGVSKIVVLNNRLTVGKEIDAEELRKIVFESDKDGAFGYALNYISRYTPTAKQLRDKLYEKGYGKAVVSHVLQKTADYGYIDDEAYARAYTELSRNVKGVVRMRSDLIGKGIDAQIVDRVLRDFQPNDSCIALARKHARNQETDDPKYIARLSRYLAYRGYEWSDIARAIDAVKSERPS